MATTSFEEEHQVDELDCEDELELPPSQIARCDVSSAQRSTALLILNLKEWHRLTQSAVTFAIGQIKQVLIHTFDDIYQEQNWRCRHH